MREERAMIILKAMKAFLLMILALTLAGLEYAQAAQADVLSLPPPRQEGRISVEKAISQRKSARVYAQGALSVVEISQILWAAQGFTRELKNPPHMWNPKYEWQGGLRTAPSAGALYPMEIYVLAGSVEDLAKGVYKYVPKDHSLKKIIGGDKRSALSNAALKQAAIERGAAVLLLAGVYERTSYKYGDRAERYVHIEAGAIAENVSLQGVALGLGMVLIGAFKDDEVKNVLHLPDDERPLIIMPLGKELHAD
jgi:SagB-type dehydrogenase family enzyme